MVDRNEAGRALTGGKPGRRLIGVATGLAIGMAIAVRVAMRVAVRMITRVTLRKVGLGGVNLGGV
jgi:hypothetical protein